MDLGGPGEQFLMLLLAILLRQSARVVLPPKLVIKAKVLENTKCIYFTHLRNWPVTQTHHKAMLLVYKENNFANPASFNPGIFRDMPELYILSIFANRTFKECLGGCTFYQFYVFFNP